MADLIITEDTLSFIDSVEYAMQSGIIKNYTDLAQKLEWNGSVLSQVMGKKRNVPRHINMRFRIFLSRELQRERDVAQGAEGAQFEAAIRTIYGRLEMQEDSIRAAMSFIVELEYTLGNESNDQGIKEKGRNIAKTLQNHLYGLIQQHEDLKHLTVEILHQLDVKRIELHQRRIGIETKLGAIGYYDRDVGVRHVFDADVLGFQGNLSCWCGTPMVSTLYGTELCYRCTTHDVQISSIFIKNHFYELLSELSISGSLIKTTKAKLQDRVAQYLNTLPPNSNSIVKPGKIDEIVEKLADLPAAYRKFDTIQIDRFFDFAFHGQIRLRKDNFFEAGYISDLLHVDESELRQKKLFIFNRKILDTDRDSAVEIKLLFNIFYDPEAATVSATVDKIKKQK